MKQQKGNIMQENDPTFHEIRLHIGSKTIAIKAMYSEYDGTVIAENDLNRILNDIERDTCVIHTSYVDEFNVTHEIRYYADRVDMIEVIKADPKNYRSMSVSDQYQLVA